MTMSAPTSVPSSSLDGFSKKYLHSPLEAQKPSSHLPNPKTHDNPFGGLNLPRTFRDVYESFMNSPETSWTEYEKQKADFQNYFDDDSGQIDPYAYVSEMLASKGEAVSFCKARLVEIIGVHGDIHVSHPDVRRGIVRVKEEFCDKEMDLPWDDLGFARSVEGWAGFEEEDSAPEWENMSEHSSSSSSLFPLPGEAVDLAPTPPTPSWSASINTGLHSIFDPVFITFYQVLVDSVRFLCFLQKLFQIPIAIAVRVVFGISTWLNRGAMVCLLLVCVFQVFIYLSGISFLYHWVSHICRMVLDIKIFWENAFSSDSSPSGSIGSSTLSTWPLYDERATQPLNFDFLDNTVVATDRLMHLGVNMAPISSMLAYTLLSLRQASDIVAASSIIQDKDHLEESISDLKNAVASLRDTMVRYDANVSAMIRLLRYQLKYILKDLESYLSPEALIPSVSGFLNPLAFIFVLISVIVYYINPWNVRAKRAFRAVWFVAIIAWFPSHCCLQAAARTSQTHLHNPMLLGTSWCPPIRDFFTPLSPFYTARLARQKQEASRSLKLTRDFNTIIQNLQLDLNRLEILAQRGLDHSKHVEQRFSIADRLRNASMERVMADIMALNLDLQDPAFAQPRTHNGFWAGVSRIGLRDEKQRRIQVIHMHRDFARLKMMEASGLKTVQTTHGYVFQNFFLATTVLEKMKQTMENMHRAATEYSARTGGIETDWKTVQGELGRLQELVNTLELQGRYQDGERERWREFYQNRYLLCEENARIREDTADWGSGESEKSWYECMFSGEWKEENDRGEGRERGDRKRGEEKQRRNEKERKEEKRKEEKVSN